MSVPRELELPGRTRSMDNELRGERADLVATLALITMPLIIAAGLAQQGQYVYAVCVGIPMLGFLLRSILRMSSIR